MSSEFYVDLNPISEAVAKFVKEKGFYTPTKLNETVDVLAKLMLITTELAEAAEAARHGDQENFEEELADTFIRLYDLCGHMGIDIGRAVDEKMAKNAGRPYKHGKLA